MPAAPGGVDWRNRLNVALGALLCVFTVSEVNYARLAPQSQLAIFAGLGFLLCFPLEWSAFV